MNISQLEDLILGARRAIAVVFVLVTAFMLWQVMGLKAETTLEKMVPLEHEYIKNLLKHKDDLGLGNDIKVAIAVKNGDIFDAQYLETVKNITDEVFYFPGVDRAKLKSLWTPTVRWSSRPSPGTARRRPDCTCWRISPSPRSSTPRPASPFRTASAACSC